MNDRRTILCLSDIFPPVAAVGTQRVVGLCRYLAEHGWRVTVVTARPRASEALDATLMADVPETVRIVRRAAPDLPRLAARLLGRSSAPPAAAPTQADARTSGDGEVVARPGALKRLAQWLSWWLYVPDSRNAWIPSAVCAALAAARCEKPAVLFSSAPMMSGHVAAAVVSRLLRVPWVADFRDPWCDNPWRDLPDGLHGTIDAALERFVLREADRVTCAWDGVRRVLCRRHPERSDRIVTVLNGFDPPALDAVAPETIDADRLVLLHAGSLYGPRSPVPLFRGLRHLRDAEPRTADRLRVVLLGPPTWDGHSLEDLARQHGVADHVDVMPPVAHRRSVALLKGADVAILFGQSGDADLSPVPAKVYEYIGAGKAVLAVGAGDEALGILRQGGCRLWAVADDDPVACATALADMVAERPIELQSGDARLAFTRDRMAARLAEHLAEVRRGRRSDVDGMPWD
jgi:Glycosyl transferase 4-like domain/Glycosyl transferases group 1